MSGGSGPLVQLQDVALGILDAHQAIGLMVAGRVADDGDARGAQSCHSGIEVVDEDVRSAARLHQLDGWVAEPGQPGLAFPESQQTDSSSSSRWATSSSSMSVYHVTAPCQSRTRIRTMSSFLSMVHLGTGPAWSRRRIRRWARNSVDLSAAR